ncbi:MAG: 2-isopropylmalate synthase [Deltaproteobacteria bacterium]|nr:2-isopropylmalate synthase [Deltaproteobacteria bacterium]
MADRILIFDTTLRDGEQSPGWSMNLDEKLAMARALEKLRVDVIEAGFPAASPGDFEAVQRIAEEIGASGATRIAGLCRTTAGDINRCWDAIKVAKRPRIHTFLATSPLHMEVKLRMQPADVLAAAVRAVEHARSLCDDVEFSCEDATRSDWAFLVEVAQAVIEAGATTVNIPDTVGYTVPHEYGALIAHLRANVRGIERATLSVHCHDDLGLAVANSLAAVGAGARQIECTVNGIGERAGNASLEEIAMALATRREAFGGLTTGIDATHLVPASRLLSRLTGVAVQPNKAIVGANAFAHEAGIHQDGVLKNKLTYEIMTPESVGLTSNKLVLGKHSGRAALRDRMKTLGYELDDASLDRLFKRFKALADKKKSVFDEDLETLVADDAATRGEQPFTLDYLAVSAGTVTIPSATVRLKIDGDVVMAAGFGSGPVDAVYQAIQALVAPHMDGIGIELLSYQVSSVTGSTDAQGGARVVMSLGGEEVPGHGVHTDVVVASALAYLEALSKFVLRRRRASGAARATMAG